MAFRRSLISISLASIQYRRKMALRAKGRKRYSDEQPH
jgi:hypothetical protein